mmetsp:Transcript_30984/g.98975  ORF Transcript_30984/g.98975 Transcript_30984/m.98975 type:complete len:257 (+) Transcript_30984:273-1043(+)
MTRKGSHSRSRGAAAASANVGNSAPCMVCVHAEARRPPSPGYSCNPSQRSAHDLCLVGKLELLRVGDLGVVLAHHLLNLRKVHGLLLDERLGQLVEQVAVGHQCLLAHLVRLSHEHLDLLVDELLGRGRGGLRPEAAVAVGRLPGRGAQLVLRIAPLRDHAARNVAHLLQVVGGTSRHLLLAKDELLGDAAAQRDGELAPQVALRVQARLEPLLGRGEEGEAARAVGPGDDRHLGHQVVVGREQAHHRVAGLVVRD